MFVVVNLSASSQGTGKWDILSDLAWLVVCPELVVRIHASALSAYIATETWRIG